MSVFCFEGATVDPFPSCDAPSLMIVLYLNTLLGGCGFVF